MAKLIISFKELLASPIISPAIVEIDIDKELAKQKQIAIVWSIEDVLEVRPELTNKKAWDVLQAVKHNHDATIGVNWETLKCSAYDLFPETSFDPKGA